MTGLEAIVGLIASVLAIIGTMIFVARYIAKRFDTWTEATIENSAVMRTVSSAVQSLTSRVIRLENSFNQGQKNG